MKASCIFKEVSPDREDFQQHVSHTGLQQISFQNLLALCEMSGKYQEHQFPLTVILPQRAASHKSGDEAHAANRAGNSWRADITAICFPALREERLLSRDITHRAASELQGAVINYLGESSLSKQITIGGIAVRKINSFISGDFPQMNFY